MSWVYYFSDLHQRSSNNTLETKLSIPIRWWYCTMDFQLKRTLCSKIFATRPFKLCNVVCQMENQTESRKKPRWSYSPGPTRHKNRTKPKTVWRDTIKAYPQVKFLGITFDSQLTFEKHFEDILDHCNTRYHRLRLLANKQWGPSPSNLTQIYKQCVRLIFEYGSLSTITTSDYIISKIQRLQNKFIRLALRLLKYICTKLLHDSFGTPYVKDRLLSCASKSPDRIASNPLVEESISSNRFNPAWDHFPTPLSVVRPVSL